jgi:DNA-directed RNA polymerase specialized sigma24 family protein
MDTSRSSPLTPGEGVGGPAAGTDASADATSGVTALYRAHALGLVRLAIVMLGDRAAAEDVVQDAFFGLYRHWAGLADPGNALTYVRSAVLNRCRNALRQRGRPERFPAAPGTGESTEAAVLVGDWHDVQPRGQLHLPRRAGLAADRRRAGSGLRGQRAGGAVCDQPRERREVRGQPAGLRRLRPGNRAQRRWRRAGAP